MQVGRIRGGSKIYMETKETILTILAIILSVILITFVPAYLFSKSHCMKAYENYEPNFSIVGGCRVKWSGRLTPVDIIREIN